MLKYVGIRFFGITALLLVTLVLAACAANSSAGESTTDAATTSSATESANTTTAENSSENGPAAPVAAPNAVTFTIVQEGTEARFSIYELLMGQDKTVVGTTSAVEGSISVDPANPSTATISPIRIDASTLATDSSRRDGAIKRWILETNQADYQYITFTPTAVEGLPENVNIGEPFTFSIIGDLTIRDVTKQETFTLTVTANSETELVGLGQTKVMRSDYNLTIPSVPSVANVGEEVPLEIAFTAVAG